MRVLLAGEHLFRDGLLEPLRNTAIDVVGHADNADQAVLMADWLRPDVVLLEACLTGGAKRIAVWSTVVTLSPGSSSFGSADRELKDSSDTRLELLRTALAVASAVPGRNPRVRNGLNRG